MLNICSACQHENEGHYKFCLACGGEITAEETGDASTGGEGTGAAGPSSSFRKPLDLRQRLEALRSGSGYKASKPSPIAGPVIPTAKIETPSAHKSGAVSEPVADEPREMGEPSAIEAPAGTELRDDGTPDSELPLEAEAESTGNELGEEESQSGDGTSSIADAPVDESEAQVDEESTPEASAPDSTAAVLTMKESMDSGSVQAASAQLESAVEQSQEFLFQSLGDTMLSLDALKDESADKVVSEAHGVVEPGREEDFADPPVDSNGEKAEEGVDDGDEEDSEARENSPIDEVSPVVEVEQKSEAPEAPVEAAGVSVGVDDRATIVSPVYIESDASVVCRTCGAAVLPAFKFCGVCGTVSGEDDQDTIMAPATEKQFGLVLIHADGSEGESFSLEEGETTIGREHASSLFASDPFLSPRHATVSVLNGQVTVRDEESLNGIFVRVKEEVELSHGDLFRLGQQLLRFEFMPDVPRMVDGSTDGTRLFGSPIEGIWGRLSEVLSLDTDAESWTLETPEVFLGREQATIVFADDAYMSSSHCRLARRQGGARLEDLNSTNGTYLRVEGILELEEGDLFLMGQQVFRLDPISPDGSHQ